MSFCNSCGASLSPGTRFCSKCGAAILASAPASASASMPAPANAPVAETGPGQPTAHAPTVAPKSEGGALKAILIAVGVIVLVGILGIASLGFFAWRIARHSRVHQDGDNVSVETPFGTVQSTKDPQEAARNLGVEIYPGAEILKAGAASATFGGVHTVSLNFETADSLDKVSGFYKARFPNAMVVTPQADQCTIISNDNKNTVTILIRTDGDRTKIGITNVSHKANAASSSSN